MYVPPVIGELGRRLPIGPATGAPLWRRSVLTRRWASPSPRRRRRQHTFTYNSGAAANVAHAISRAGQPERCGGQRVVGVVREVGLVIKVKGATGCTDSLRKSPGRFFERCAEDGRDGIELPGCWGLRGETWVAGAELELAGNTALTSASASLPGRYRAVTGPLPGRYRAVTASLPPLEPLPAPPPPSLSRVVGS